MYFQAVWTAVGTEAFLMATGGCTGPGESPGVEKPQAVSSSPRTGKHRSSQEMPPGVPVEYLTCDKKKKRGGKSEPGPAALCSGGSDESKAPGHPLSYS